jgi:hypothetical protein
MTQENLFFHIIIGQTGAIGGLLRASMRWNYIPATMYSTGGAISRMSALSNLVFVAKDGTPLPSALQEVLKQEGKRLVHNFPRLNDPAVIHDILDQVGQGILQKQQSGEPITNLYRLVHVMAKRGAIQRFDSPAVSFSGSCLSKLQLGSEIPMLTAFEDVAHDQQLIHRIQRAGRYKAFGRNLPLRGHLARYDSRIPALIDVTSAKAPRDHGTEDRKEIGPSPSKRKRKGHATRF